MWKIVGITIVNLATATLQHLQDLADSLVPNPFPPVTPTPSAPGPSDVDPRELSPPLMATPDGRDHGAVVQLLLEPPPSL